MSYTNVEVDEMYQQERIQKILQLLQNKGRLTKQEIMATFAISSDTARRDILQVCQSPKVIRTHGGIMLANPDHHVFDFFQREQLAQPEKKRMSHCVVEQLVEGGVYFFDVSTTLVLAAKEVNLPCSIYTHSLDVAFELATKEKVTVHLLGGVFDFANRFFYSPAEVALLNQVKFDQCFLGGASIEPEGVFFKEQTNANIKRQVIHQSRLVTLVAEHQKFSKQATYLGIYFPEIHQFITDQEMTIDEKNYFNETTKICR